jgi:preprotein translocase subunit SecD
MVNLPRWKIVVVVLAALFGIFFTLPNLLPANVRDSLPGFLPKKTLNLGLDLQGGSHLLLEVDINALRTEKLNNLVEDVRTHMREEKIDITGLGVVNGDVTLRVTDPTRISAAAKALRQLGAPLAGVGGGRDVSVSVEANQVIRIRFVPEALTSQAQQAVTQSIEIFRRRIDALGTKEPSIVRQGANRIVVEAPGESDPERLEKLIGQTAKLSFQLVDDSVSLADAQAGRLPPGSMIVPSEEGRPGEPALVLKRRILVNGEMLTDAQPGFDQQTGGPEVNFRFNAQGARRFGDVTTQSVGKRFAIVLDNKVISSPTIQTPITGGSGRITGNYTPQTASDLAVLLRAGALPAPVTVEERRTVSAELGADAIRAGVISLAIGAVAMLVFILLAYGLFGVFAAVALIINVLMIIGFMSLTQATLTFPGIAGLILTLAVAVDANVIIYERVRDEAHAGRTVTMALEHGYSRALISIIDANITSLISALIMFTFGAGVIKGFAWTLAIGVFTSVFTAVLVTQVFIGLWLRSAKPKTLPMA